MFESYKAYRERRFRERLIVSFIEFVILIAVFIFMALKTVYGSTDKALQAILTFIICGVSFVMMILIKNHFGEIKTFEMFLGKPSPDKNFTYISNKYITPDYVDDYVIDSVSWYSKKYFYLDFYNRPSLKVNKERAFEYVKKCPLFVKIPHWVFIITAVICSAFSLFGYKPVSNGITNSNLSSDMKTLFDNLAFWAPCAICFLCAVLILISTILRFKEMKKLCKLIVDENITITKYSQMFEEKISDLNNRWYYNNCPKCRHLAEEGEPYCPMCDEYLLIKDIKDVFVKNRHQIIRDYSKKQILDFEAKYPSGL